MITNSILVKQNLHENEQYIYQVQPSEVEQGTEIKALKRTIIRLE